MPDAILRNTENTESVVKEFHMVNTNSIINIIQTIAGLTAIFAQGDGIAFFDRVGRCVIVVDAVDYLSSNYDNCITIKKASQLNNYNRVFFANLEEFIMAYPDSNIEAYIINKSSNTDDNSIGKYIAAYVHLYKCYKSLSTLAENNFTEFIDAFIDTCMSEEDDHPRTISYTAYELYKVLGLRKAVFEMFKKYLNNYNTYKTIHYLQHSKKFSDKEFREIKKKIRAKLKEEKESQKREKEKSTATSSALVTAA